MCLIKPVSLGRLRPKNKSTWLGGPKKLLDLGLPWPQVKSSVMSGGPLWHRPWFPPETERLRASPSSFPSALWEGKKKKRLREYLKFYLGQKHHCSKLGKFQAMSNQKISQSKESAILKRQYPKWHTWSILTKHTFSLNSALTNKSTKFLTTVTKTAFVVNIA